MERSDIERVIARLEKRFLKPHVELMSAWLVDTSEGTEIVPADLIGDEKAQECGKPTIEAVAQYCEGTPHEHPGGPDFATRPDGVEGLADAEHVSGYFARLSAPGYMDCTDWGGPFDSTREAEEYLAETYGSDLDDDADDDDSDDSEY